jgi:hypothetical protein
MSIGLAPVRADTASTSGLLFKREAYECVPFLYMKNPAKTPSPFTFPSPDFILGLKPRRQNVGSIRSILDLVNYLRTSFCSMAKNSISHQFLDLRITYSDEYHSTTVMITLHKCVPFIPETMWITYRLAAQSIIHSPLLLVSWDPSQTYP